MIWIERVQQRDAELKDKVYVEGGRIIMNVTSEYDIDLNRCDTHEKILAWVVHLSEKAWITQEVLIKFIQRRCLPLKATRR
jgi:hypothetical protein